MVNKVAVVTGSNKGIGYSIVKELCRRGVSVVYLTARDEKRGRQSVETLKNEGINPEFHQLDVSDINSVKTFANYLKTNHGHFDILINNAAIIGNIDNMTYEDCKHVIDVNFRSLFKVQDYLFPLLNDNARVINMSSNVGHIVNLKNVYWIKRLTNESVEVKDIDDFVNWFLESVKNNKINADDFLSLDFLAYRVSKIAVSALTRVQQRHVERGISINSLHPGFVRTDMTKKYGVLTAEEASESSVYLALDCDQSIKGKYIWYDKTEKDWTDLTIKIFDEKEVEEIDKFKKALKVY